MLPPDGLTLRPWRDADYNLFIARIVATTHADLAPDQQERYSATSLTSAVKYVVELLMEQGDNLILIADLPDYPNGGQVWLGTARDPYTGEQLGYIYDLYVEPDLRGRGIAQALLAAAEQASRTRGDTAIGLAVASHNPAAQTLYAALGFHPERLTMRKPL